MLGGCEYANLFMITKSWIFKSVHDNKFLFVSAIRGTSFLGGHLEICKNMHIYTYLNVLKRYSFIICVYISNNQVFITHSARVDCTISFLTWRRNYIFILDRRGSCFCVPLSSWLRFLYIFICYDFSYNYAYSSNKLWANI